MGFTGVDPARKGVESRSFGLSSQFTIAIRGLCSSGEEKRKKKKRRNIERWTDEKNREVGIYFPTDVKFLRDFRLNVHGLLSRFSGYGMFERSEGVHPSRVPQAWRTWIRRFSRTWKKRVSRCTYSLSRGELSRESFPVFLL